MAAKTYPIFAFAVQAAPHRRRSVIHLRRLRPSSSVVLSLLAHVSTRARVLLTCTVIAGLFARLAIVAAAFAIVDEDARDAMLIAVAGSAAFVAQRIASAALRISVECDLYAASARSVLNGDVLTVETVELHQLVPEGIYHAEGLLADHLPALVADVVVCVVVAPILARSLPLRFIELGVIALAVVMAGVLTLRRTMQRIEKSVQDAYHALLQDLLVATHARLELVARGAEDEFLRRFAERTRRYRELGTRLRAVSAFLGRAPVAVAAVAVGGAVLADTGLREQLATELVAKAIVLAACLPRILAASLGALQIAKTGALVRPLTGVLLTPRRYDRRGTRAADVRLVSMKHLRFRYDPASRAVLDDVSLDWARGASLVICGANGSGKSTLLRLLLALRPPTGGAIRIDGEHLSELDVRGLRRRTAFLPQRAYLGEDYATLRFALRLFAANADDEAMRAALKRAGLSCSLDTLVGELSSGQRQRVALARVLLAEDAQMVLLDEPDANLDRDGVDLVMRLVREMKAQGKMVAIAAHSSELVDVADVKLEL